MATWTWGDKSSEKGSAGSQTDFQLHFAFEAYADL